uniref:CCAAT-binding factor domain-containing protein n=1 Tax=Alexandrium monilatum TaxID=311494 RepID=A0A7S4WAC1_9DINO
MAQALARSAALGRRSACSALLGPLLPMGGRGAPASAGSNAGAGAGGGLSGSTKALIEALRGFSSERWWHIGAGDGTEPPAPRRRGKPEEFQKQCAEKHAEMKKLYESAMMEDSEQRWLRKVSSQGTSGDRVASLTMLIQVCPVFATGHIKALLGMAGRTERSDSIMAMDGLKDLFISNLLPDRKLKTLSQMEAISPKGLSKEAFTELCVVAFFEDYLKTAFAAYVQILSEIAHSTVVFFKSKAIRTAYELLVSKPEQERALLGLLINKFGDSAPKVSSNASFCVKKLVQAHPAMKMVITKEVEAFLARPNITTKAQYFALLYLSETVYSRRDGELAAQIIRLFVTQLEVALQNSRRPRRDLKPKKWRMRRAWQPMLGSRRPGSGLIEDDNRLIRTLITGIQRALPYLGTTTASGSPLQQETLDALFRVGHTVAAFPTRIAVMDLLYRCVSSGGGQPMDRFFRLLHEQIARFDIFTCSHRLQALLLLRRCVPPDSCCTRAVALSRRMLQLGACGEPPLAAASLSLLKQVLAPRRKELQPLLGGVEADLRAKGFDEDESKAADLGPEEEHFGDDDKQQPVAEAAGSEDTAAKMRYNPSAREPRYARARRSPLWELYALSNHVHPFVAHGASKILSAGTYEDTSDNPFEKFSCTELLDQFVSSSKAQRGPQRDKDKSKVRIKFTTESFATKKKVQPHERFFQLYFTDDIVREMKGVQDERKKKKKRQGEEDFDEEGEGRDDDDEVDAFFTKHLEESMPPEDSDVDIDDGDEEDDFVEDEDFDDGEAEAGGEPEPGSDAAESGGDEDEPSEEAEKAPGGGQAQGKRSAAEAGLPQKRPRAGRNKRKKISGPMFASVEEFEHLMAADFA